MMWIKAEFDAQLDWIEAQRHINDAIKKAVPDSKRDLQGYLNNEDYLFDEQRELTMLFHNEKPIVLFGFNENNEFIVEIKKGERAEN